MPTYVCSIGTGSLSPKQKSEIASNITRVHAEATGAPAYLVQVVIEERSNSELFLGGEPASRQIYIRGDIRAGRTQTQRERLMLDMMAAVSRIAVVDQTSVWINLCNLEPTDMLEYGHVLPAAGKEQEWFDKLPAALKTHLTALGAAHAKKFALYKGQDDRSKLRLPIWLAGNEISENGLRTFSRNVSAFREPPEADTAQGCKLNSSK
jgi:phenylpyruvate tautomerase PptA (4-oxalocrotonate tautomerase family)